MIVSLSGKLQEIGSQACIVEVQGVGYELGISNTSLAELPNIGEDLSLYVRMRITESSVSLYGFATKEERALFDKLTSISGIGPKVALSILSAYTPEYLATISVADDLDSLTSISGVGKKTAARLLVELKNIFAHDMELAALSSHASPEATHAKGSFEAECIAALGSMGFSTDEAKDALRSAKEAGADTLERAISKSLKYLGGGAHVGS